MQNTHVEPESQDMRVATALYMQHRRAHLIDSLFIDQYVREDFDPDEDYQIWIITGLERTYVSLQAGHWDRPCRIWVNQDGSVFVGADDVGSDGSIMPHLDRNAGCWYDGDEIQQVGEFVFEEGEEHLWEFAMGGCEASMNPCKPETLKLIIERYNLGNDENE